MGPKRSSCGGGNKRKTLTIELKKEIVEIFEKGVKQKDIAAKFQLHKNTVQTILANKEKIKNARVSKGISKVHAESQRKNFIDDMERLLLIWINERRMKGDSPTQDMICERARFIYENLKGKQQQGCPNGGKEAYEEFKASRGWYHRFCKRTGINSVAVLEEVDSCDKGAADKFAEELRNIIKIEGYVKQQLFNADETGLYWKKMPSRTYITQDESKLPGMKPMKDRLTLLLGANCSGDFKLKPLLVYKAENPKSFKKKAIVRSKLPVMWRANKKACITEDLFKEWMSTVFAPSVKTYLEKNDLPLKALLILGNGPGHPEKMEKILQESISWLKILYMPPDTSVILQPMDQLVITNFKKLYTRALFKNCFDNCQYSTSEQSVKQFWKDEYDIVEAIKLIQKAWEQVTEKTLNSAWRALTPDFVSEKAASDDDIVEEIISTAHELEMEVDEEDVQKLIQEDQEHLSVEELKQLANEYLQGAHDEISSDDEKREIKIGPVPTSVIKELITKWEDIRKIVSEWHPSHFEVNQVSDLFENKAIDYFRDIQNERKKQSALDSF